MPIEKVTPVDRASVASVRLEREDYWCRELCTYYPYGLNDNVRGVGNISNSGGFRWFSSVPEPSLVELDIGQASVRAGRWLRRAHAGYVSKSCICGVHMCLSRVATSSWPLSRPFTISG